MLQRLHLTCFLLSVFIVGTVFFLSPSTSYAVDCTAAQAALRARGIDIPCTFSQSGDLQILSGDCPDPARVIQELKAKSNRPESINKLTPEFACRLWKFIGAAPGNITIGVGTYIVTRSAARGDDCTRFSCIEGTNTHPLGCAADLLYDGKCYDTASCAANPCNTIQSCIWAHQNAESAGLQYRLMPGHPRFPGTPEWWHIELKDGDLTRCQGGQASPPLASSVPAPTSGLSSLFRRALGLPQQPPPLLPTQALQPVSVDTSSAVTSAFTPSPLNAVPGATDVSYTPTAQTGGTDEATRRLIEIASTQSGVPIDPRTVVPIVFDDSAAIAPPSGSLTPVGNVVSAPSLPSTYNALIQASFAPVQDTAETSTPWYLPYLQPMCGRPGGCISGGQIQYMI